MLLGDGRRVGRDSSIGVEVSRVCSVEVGTTSTDVASIVGEGLVVLVISVSVMRSVGVAVSGSVSPNMA
jgi:hypothetical protein